MWCLSVGQKGFFHCEGAGRGIQLKRYHDFLTENSRIIMFFFPTGGPEMGSVGGGKVCARRQVPAEFLSI